MGEKFKTYLFSYSFQGARWHFELKAASREDALERFSRLAFATLDGEAVAKIEVPTARPGALAEFFGRAMVGLYRRLLPRASQPLPASRDM